MEKYSHNKIDSGDEHAEYSADPVMKAILDERQFKRTGEKYDIVRSLEDHVYAGTGTKAELIELECNLMFLLNEKKYGWNYIANYLRNLGYQDNIVRITFRKLTGVDPSIYHDPQPFLDTPSTIPGISYGWGKAKDKKYDYYFIMPYNLGYQVFGQKGDLQRDEVVYFLALTASREYLEKHTHEAFWWDKIEKYKINEKKLDKQELSEPLPIGTKTAKYQFLKSEFDKMGEMTTYTERRAMIKIAMDKKELPAEEGLELLAKYGFNKYANPDVESLTDQGDANKKNELIEDLENEADEMMNKPLEEELNEVTPDSFFQPYRDDASSKDLHLFIKEVMDYLDALNADTKDYKVNMQSFKYVKKSSSSRLEENIITPNSNIEEMFLTGATIAVIMTITDNSLSAENNTKMGMTIFTVVNGSVITTGTFKGVDDKVYSLSEEGMEKYFFEEQNKKQ